MALLIAEFVRGFTRKSFTKLKKTKGLVATRQLIHKETLSICRLSAGTTILGPEETMAVERNLDVGALIETKLARPQVEIVLWLCTLMVLEGYDMQTLSFATPAILREWHVGRSDFGFVLTAHLVGYFVGAMVLSFFGDRIGRKNIIVTGAMIFGAFTFAAGFATSPQELYLLRLGAGFGLPGMILDAAEDVGRLKYEIESCRTAIGYRRPSKAQDVLVRAEGCSQITLCHVVQALCGRLRTAS